MANIVFGGRVVGEVRADGYFQKRLDFSRQLLQKPKKSIAINFEVLDAAERAGAHSVEIIDADTGQPYRAAIAKIRARGFYVSRGQGPQAALPLSEWDTGQTRGEQLPEVEPTETAEQLTLWR